MYYILVKDGTYSAEAGLYLDALFQCEFYDVSAQSIYYYFAGYDNVVGGNSFKQKTVADAQMAVLESLGGQTMWECISAACEDGPKYITSGLNLLSFATDLIEFYNDAKPYLEVPARDKIIWNVFDNAGVTPCSSDLEHLQTQWHGWMHLSKNIVTTMLMFMNVVSPRMKSVSSLLLESSMSHNEKPEEVDFINNAWMKRSFNCMAQKLSGLLTLMIVSTGKMLGVRRMNCSMQDSMISVRSVLSYTTKRMN